MANVAIARKIYFSSGVTDHASASKYGQGYNFELEATIEGPLDPVSGLVMNLTDLDGLLKKVTKQLDHKHLFFEVEEFRGKIYSLADLGNYCFKTLADFFVHEQFHSKGLILKSIRLQAGDDSWVVVNK